MQDCPDWTELTARASIQIRWCPEHRHWIVSAWAKRDGDSPFVEVHPMWLEPRVIGDDEHTDGTLLQLLRSASRTAQRLAGELRSGQATLW